MTDVNKPKLQLRSGLSMNGEKTPSPATKLLISHGKPNFTIQRSIKARNTTETATCPSAIAPCNDNSSFLVKSTTFNGVFKPSNISDDSRHTLPQNGNISTSNGTDNEVAKVVLRRANITQSEMTVADDDENVPEFIRRQRRIQERLANQNILDFENRRSGYFTQVLISPSSPNRQSFVETMARPAVKPGLEIPPPQSQFADIEEEINLNAYDHEQKESELEKSKESTPQSVTINGQVEEDEVAKAIEEVNKAVEGEDDEKTELEECTKSVQEEGEQNITSTVIAATISHPAEVLKSEADINHTEIYTFAEEIPTVAGVATSAIEQTIHENVHADPMVAPSSLIEDTIEEPNPIGVIEAEHVESSHVTPEKLDSEITISHANGINGPSIPAPDPKDEKGVNFEPKTVVSFSQELGKGDNKYPDTVIVVKDVEISEGNSVLKELTKLKFEIKVDTEDVEIKPVLITENA